MLADFDFPALNAGLNSLSGVLIVLGYIAIRRRLVRAHMTCMLTALVVSAAVPGLVPVLPHCRSGGQRDALERDMAFRGAGLVALAILCHPDQSRIPRRGGDPDGPADCLPGPDGPAARSMCGWRAGPCRSGCMFRSQA